MASQFKIRNFINFLTSETIKENLHRGEPVSILDSILEFLRKTTEADYIAITVWDTEKDIPYLHRFICDDFYLPPAKPGRGPLGVCMLEKRAVYGSYSDFPKGSKELSERIGPVLCIPIEIPQKNLLGAIGVGRKKKSPPFSRFEDITLKMASNIASIIISIVVLRDLLEKERKISQSLFKILSETVNLSPHERIVAIVKQIKDIFEATFAVLGEIDKKNKKIKIVFSEGIDVKGEIEFGKGVLGITALSGKPHLFKNYPYEMAPESYKEEVLKVGSVLTSPIYVEQNPKYIIAIGKKREEKPFSQEDLYLFSMFEKVFSFIFELTESEIEREKLRKLKERTAKIESLGLLAGGIAHDFNNILNIIMGYAQLGLENTKEKDTKELLQLIFNQCKLAANLTSQILLIGRTDTAQFHIINVKPLIKGIVKMLIRTMPENIKVEYSDDGHQEYYIWGNPSHIQTIILNLASNAKDAMPEGGILKISLKKIRKPPMFDMDSENCIVIEVEDTGKGIPKEIIDKIFDPFFTTKEIGKGTGLGLSQVHSSVTSLKGLIDVTSTVGKGTKFTIYLPEAKREEIPDVKMDEYKRKTMESKGILLVEDNIELLKVIEKMLNKLSAKTFSASNYEEAKKLFHKHKDEIDILITDVVLPDVSGIKLAEELKKENDRLNIIFITGYSDKVSQLTEFAKKNHAHIILKPFPLFDLTEALRNIS